LRTLVHSIHPRDELGVRSTSFFCAEAALGYDYVAPMKRVATRFAGNPGVYLQLGDSLTYAFQNTAWAREGKDHTPDEREFLSWSHCGERDFRDGWHLASVDVGPNRCHTAASGVRADKYLSGGKHGLPSLAEILARFKPQLALYMLGSNDLYVDRPVDCYAADVEQTIDLLLTEGIVPILSTLPPCRGLQDRVKDFNRALRALAARRRLPLIDLYAEMSIRAGSDMERVYLGRDGFHLSTRYAFGPASEERLRTCGYLLRCYLAVRKGMEVKARVLSSA
jgi:lysophospholipase L1-like esterase